MKYSYIKKFNVDYNMNPAPWAKQGCGSFNSKVSFKLLRFQKRKLNKRFYNSQDIYLKKVIQYFYLRYCEDFQRDTYQSFKSIFRNLRHLLIGNFFSQSYYASN